MRSFLIKKVGASPMAKLSRASAKKPEILAILFLVCLCFFISHGLHGAQSGTPQFPPSSHRGQNTLFRQYFNNAVPSPFAWSAPGYRWSLTGGAIRAQLLFHGAQPGDTDDSKKRWVAPQTETLSVLNPDGTLARYALNMLHLTQGL